MGNYDDIINRPHYVSHRHPRMSMLARAAQFAPFAALTGYGAAIDEIARLTEQQVELEDYDNGRLNRAIARLAAIVYSHPTTTFNIFVPDGRKSGGSYQTVTGEVKRIDNYAHQIVLMDGRTLSLSNITDIRINE